MSTLLFLPPSKTRTPWRVAIVWNRRIGYGGRYAYMNKLKDERFIKTLDPNRMHPLRQKPISPGGLQYANVYLSPDPLPKDILEQDTLPQDIKEKVSWCSLRYSHFWDPIKKRDGYYRFPDNINGYFYLRTASPSESPRSAEIRFRVVPDAPSPTAMSQITPATFLSQFWQQGQDLLLSAPPSSSSTTTINPLPSLPLSSPLPQTPWAIPIISCLLPEFRPLWQQIVNEKLLDEATLSTIARYPTRRHCTIRKGRRSKALILFDFSDLVSIGMGKTRKWTVLDAHKNEWISSQSGLALFRYANWKGRVDVRFRLSSDALHQDRDVLVFEVVDVDPILEPRASRKANYLKPVVGELLMQRLLNGDVVPVTLDLDSDDVPESLRDPLKSLARLEREKLCSVGT